MGNFLSKCGADLTKSQSARQVAGMTSGKKSQQVGYFQIYRQAFDCVRVLTLLGGGFAFFPTGLHCPVILHSERRIEAVVFEEGQQLLGILFSGS